MILTYNIVRVLDVFLCDCEGGNHSRDADGADTVSCQSTHNQHYQFQPGQGRRHNNTYAAPNPSMPITASFFLYGSWILRTIGTGNINIAQSATTSVKSSERNMGTVCTHEFP